MPKQNFQELAQRLRKAQQEMDEYFDILLTQKRQEFHYHIEQGKAVFENKMSELMKEYKVDALDYITRAPITYLLSAPIIYGMLIPLAFMDLTITIYQHICFRIYGIPLVSRKDYIVIDRHRLPYLNTIQKLNCIYCGYGNGLMAYAGQIIARTEQYWCPIKHAKRAKSAHMLTEKFVDYGDAEALKTQWVTIRKNWK